MAKLRLYKNSEYDQEISQSQAAREEELLNQHETPGRQIKQSNQLSLPHQDDCNTRMDIKRTTKHRTITDSHNGSNNKRKVNNRTNRTALERTAA